MIKIDLSHAKLASSIFDKQSDVSRIHSWIHEKTYKGSDYLGWVDWPLNYDTNEFERVIKAAEKIRSDADVLLVIGVGGSYLGARAAIEFVKGLYDESKPKIYYVGNTFSSTALLQILNNIEGKSVYVNVISKSGTTTETALAFRMIRLKMQEWYGDEAKNRIFATTDKARGTLKQLSNQMGYETFTIPDDVGGRYSVFTSVGLLPIAAAGVDIRALMKGSLDAYHDLNTDDLALNPAYQYAVARKLLEASGKSIEIMVSYESHFGMLAEWWKQLFGESEGKEGKGLFPASVINSTDLHSMGQFIQEGKKVFFESVLRVNEVLLDGVVLTSENDTDQINYLGGKSLHWVNQQALLGTLSAHVNEGNVPNIIIDIPKHDAYTFGYLIYFYFKAVAMSVYMDDVNPFDQPGVEVYKRNMFKLLGK
jgi:glucose-6-phosphate isomerase